MQPSPAERQSVVLLAGENLEALETSERDGVILGHLREAYELEEALEVVRRVVAKVRAHLGERGVQVAYLKPTS